MNASVEQFLSGKLTQVDVAGIEKEIKELWSSVETSAQGTATDRQHPLVARICVLNLVLYSEDSDAELSAGNLLDEVSVRYPCRAILAIARTNDIPKLEAWVSTRCHLASDTKQICCEQITVRWEGQGVDELPSVVIPLLLPDLPVVLWWRTTTLDVKAIKPFLRSVDKIIVDSSYWKNSIDYFNILFDQVNAYTVVCDLNWRRIYRWRYAIANIFNGANAASGLQLIEKVTILYSLGCCAQAFLLLGWIASRLNWQMVSVEGKIPNSLVVKFELNGKNIFVNLSAQDSKNSFADAELSNVSIELSNGNSYSFDFVVKDNVPLLVVKDQSGSSKSFHADEITYKEAMLLELELKSLEHDLIYDQSIQMVQKIIKLMGV